MRSTLKKSLYLGLAALSFASVAGAANNADAAKKTKPAKTYATASYQNIPDQGQSNVAYNVTGSNALFNKPGTVKGAKQTASKATMSDLASSKQNFMVYQTATTNRGSKYIKVVSFDKQYRGWIYAGNNTSAGYGTGVQQINLATSASPQYSNVYLKNPGITALKSSPEGSQFNASADTFSHTGFVADHSFNVNGAQTVSRTGTTWYHLIDNNDSTISGWVPSDQVQLTKSTTYFDKTQDVRVNFTNNNGQVVQSSIVNINSAAKRDDNPNYSNTNIRKASDVVNLINNLTLDSGNSNSPLYNSGYQLASNVTGINKISNQVTSDLAGLSFVEPGDSINVPVQSNGNSVASKVNFYAEGGFTQGATKLTSNDFTAPSLTSDMQSQLGGTNSRQFIDPSSVFDTGSTKLFSTPSNNTTNINGLGALYGKNQTATTNDMKNAYNGNTAYAANDQGNASSTPTTINSGDKYHYEFQFDQGNSKSQNNSKQYGDTLNAYYTPVLVKGTINAQTQSTNTNYLN